MNKKLFYIMIPVVAAIAVLLFTGKNRERKVFDERVTLRKRDKTPYGTYLAYEGLKHFFPNANFITSKKAPASWDSLKVNEEGQALIIVSQRFYADEDEMKKLIRFAENGNDVFVSAMVYSEDVRTMLHCSTSYFDLNTLYYKPTASDSLTVSLIQPPFPTDDLYSYPGAGFESRFVRTDTSTSTVLGRGTGNSPNFIHLRAGKGNLFFHLAPLAFSNYFLLHRNNNNYYEALFSVLSPGLKKIAWDEYFINKMYDFERNDKRSGWFKALLSYTSLKFALITAILTLLLYTLSEMRRKQRFIPVVARPQNDSLEFVKTIGRLYYDRGDHLNLSRKMAAYFHEYIRNRYKIVPAADDEEFIQQLQYKTGYKEEGIRTIVDFIRKLDNADQVNSDQLAAFHKELETFYKTA